MSADRNVTSAFVRVLVVEFVERRQLSLTLDAANDQTVAMVRTLRRSGHVEIPSVGSLAQRLAETYAEAFTWDGSRLLLTERAVTDRAAVFDALRAFHALIIGEAPPTAHPAPTQPAVPPQTQEKSAKEDLVQENKKQDSKALDDFFDGYERDIMKARLGQEAGPGNE